jgi:serine/threonine-protein kinase
MGAVYEAARLPGKERVAIKVLHSRLADSPRALARFRQEMEIVSRLPRTGVPAVLDYGATDSGLPFIVMEYLDGEDLEARLRRTRRLTLEETLDLVDQVASVLGEASRLGVVHRDVKPRNLFLVRDGTRPLDVRLLDFGICHLQEGTLGRGLTQTSSALLGTPGFLAPEQVADGAGKVGPPTDVFALACVVYRALSGTSAFPARNPAGAVFEALNHHPVPLGSVAPDLPHQIEWVLEIAFAKDPELRHRDALEFATELRAAAELRLSPAAGERVASLRASRVTDSTVTSVA